MTVKRWISLCCMCSIFYVAFAQNTLKINNNVTPQHQKVFGTKLYMIVPDGFEQSVEITGFQQVNTKNSILVKEAAGNYKALTQTFMAENMAVKGLKLIGQEKLTLNGDEATLFKLTQKVDKFNFAKYLLFFGDESYCVLLSAVFAPDNAALEDKIKKSLFSVAFKEEEIESPMPKGFRLDFKNSNLKYARSISDAVIYSADGLSVPNSLANNSFFAGSGKATTTDYAAFSLERLQKQIKTPLKVESNKPLEIRGLQGQEIIATTITADGKTRYLYQVLLFRENTYYIMNASSMENTETQMTAFQRIAKTFVLE
jgi:hypothetical protein